MFMFLERQMLAGGIITIIIFNSLVVQACGPTSANSVPSVQTCATCATDILTLSPASTTTAPQQGTVVLGAITMNAAGCNTLPVTCTGTIGGLLQFNSTTIPADCLTNFGPTCMETLVCNSQGLWTFTQAGITTTVNTITCQVF